MIELGSLNTFLFLQFLLLLLLLHELRSWNVKVQVESVQSVPMTLVSLLRNTVSKRIGSDYFFLPACVRSIRSSSLRYLSTDLVETV